MPAETVPPTTAAKRTAVCSWSLEPANLRDLLDKLALAGVSRVQLDLDPLHVSPDSWRDFAAVFAQNKIELVSGMVRCVGEDYSTLESIRLTGGIAPDGTWTQNLENFGKCAAIAAQLRLPLITLHAGFFPHKEDKAGFEKMISRVAAVADLFATHGIALGLETGQETAAELAEFLTALNNKNTGVNFDPANMILYGKGDPVDALGVLAPWLRQIHIKDARYAKTAGEWGEEVATGEGAVDWPRFLEKLASLNYTGDLVIEREAGTQRVADIRTARDLLAKYLHSNHQSI